MPTDIKIAMSYLTYSMDNIVYEIIKLLPGKKKELVALIDRSIN